MSKKVYGKTLLDEMMRRQEQELPLSLVKQANQAILDLIQEGLVNDGVVRISNFGSFRLKPIAERKGYNPKTRQRMILPAHQRVTFTPCKALRERIQPERLPAEPIAPAPSPQPAQTEPAQSEANAEPLPQDPVAPLKKSSKSKPLPAKEVRQKDPSPATVPEQVLPQEPDVPISRQASMPVSMPASIPASVSAAVPVQNKPDAQAAPEVIAETNPTDSKPDTQPDTQPDTGPDTLADTRHTPATNKRESREQIQQHTMRLEAEVKTQATTGRGTNATAKKYAGIGAAVLLIIAIVSAALRLDSDKDSQQLATDELATKPMIETDRLALATTNPDSKPASTTVSAPKPGIDGANNRTESEMAEQEIKTRTKPETKPDTKQDTAATANTTMPIATRPAVLFFEQQPHKIVRNESLWRLAATHYKNPYLWPHIYQTNSKIIRHPDQLIEGKSIVLPDLQGGPGNLSKTDRRHLAEGYYLLYLHYKKTGHKDALPALLEVKRYDNQLMEKYRGQLQLGEQEMRMLNR